MWDLNLIDFAHQLILLYFIKCIALYDGRFHTYILNVIMYDFFHQISFKTREMLYYKKLLVYYIVKFCDIWFITDASLIKVNKNFYELKCMFICSDQAETVMGLLDSLLKSRSSELSDYRYNNKLS